MKFNLKHTACSLLILCSTQQYAENAPIEQIQSDTLQRIALMKKEDACEAIKKDIEAIAAQTKSSFEELTAWCFQLVDTKNKESKEAHLERLNAKIEELQATITLSNKIITHTETPKKIKATMTRTVTVLAAFHKAVVEVYKKLKDYDNSTSAKDVFNLGMSLYPYNHLFPKQIRNNYSVSDWKNALTHRIECSRKQ